MLHLPDKISALLNLLCPRGGTGDVIGAGQAAEGSCQTLNP
jgi:hypothetical protein